MTWINDGKPFTAGDDWVLTVTLYRSSSVVDVTGSTVTCSIWRVPPNRKVESIADHSVTLTTPGSGVVTLTVTDTESAPLLAGTYEADFKVVYSDATVEHFTDANGEAFKFKVRRALT